MNLSAKKPWKLKESLMPLTSHLATSSMLLASMIDKKSFFSFERTYTKEEKYSFA